MSRVRNGHVRRPHGARERRTESHRAGPSGRSRIDRTVAKTLPTGVSTPAGLPRTIAPRRLFGTNGIREVVGQQLTPPFATAVAGAVGRFLPAGSLVALGWDGRTSSPSLAKVVSGTLTLCGHHVLELGILPTPAIQLSVPAVGAALGVIITASHNPPEFNGFKIIDATGLEVDRATEEALEASIRGAPPTGVSFDRIMATRTDTHGAARYLEALVARVDADRIRARRPFVVLDCGNGASAVTSPELLRRLGCRVVTLNAQLDGTFPGRPSEPTEANLAQLRTTVPAVGADLGIAHDGDADRAVFVDAAGQFVPGERSLTLFAREQVRSAGGGIVVTPVSSSQSVEDVVRSLGGQVVYTRIGSPTVTREMRRLRAVFGGEENGGVIFPKHQFARDGAMAAAAMLDLLATAGTSVAKLIAELPSYFLRKEKIPCPEPLMEDVLIDLERRLTPAADKAVTIDGLKLYRNNGWVLIRRSGTEPLLRAFAEAKDRVTADRLLAETLDVMTETRDRLARERGIKLAE